MTSLLQDKLQEIHSQAPSPSKDFHHFTITKPEVIWRSSRISFQPNQEKIFPKEVRKPHSDILLNEQLHKQMQNIFGNKMLEYTLNLCQGCYDFLARMPDNLILHILSFLNTDDIRQLSKTCKKFQQLCSREELWERVRRLQDKHTNELKIMRVPVYKKLTYFNQKPSQRRCREDRPHSFKCDWQLSD
ncbi:F-box only protein 36-like isoform X2 [Lepidochelys kempii]